MSGARNMDEPRKKIEKGLLARLQSRAAHYSSLISSVSLDFPGTPQLRLPAQAAAPRKYPLFQELSALRQEIRDDFSKAQLDLRDMSARLGGGAPQSAPGSRPEEPAEEPAARPAPVRAEVKYAAEPAPPKRYPAPEKKNIPAAAPSPAESAGFKKAGAALAAAAVIAAAVFLFNRSVNLGAVTIFALPNTRAAGLCLSAASDRLFFADPQRQLLFTLSGADGQVKSVQSFPAEGLKALAYDGAFFWSANGRSLFRHALGAHYAVEKTFDEAGRGTYSLYWDGKYLWTGGEPGGKLSRYLPADMGTPDWVFSMPPVDSAGIAVEDGFLWSLDPSTKKLGVYRLAPTLELVREANLSKLLGGKAAVSGFTMDKERVWVITEGPPELRLLLRKAIKFSSTK